MPAFIAPALPLTARRAASAATTPRVPAMALSRRAFSLAAVSAAIAAVTRPDRAAAAVKDLAVTDVKTAEGAKVLTALVAAGIKKDPSMAATLLRLAFHDSFTFDLDSGKGGANGSIRFETGRGENSGLARAVDMLKPIQSESGLSWGDTVALAGAVAVKETGGPQIPVPLGRPTADVEDPRGALPSLTETVPELQARFLPRGLNTRDIVALSGAHTLGKARGSGPFVAEPNRFKNDYFKNLMWFQERRIEGASEKTGPPDRPNFQLPSDMHLLDDPETLKTVSLYAKDEKAFFKDFSNSYLKMVAIGTPFASR